MRRFFLLLPLLLSACGGMPKLAMPDLPKFDVGDYFSVYRADIRQGNYVTQEMIAQLRPGLTREQVRFALGTPLVTDLFHADRWDYIYRYAPGHGEVQQRRLSVHFEDNKLVRVGGDVVPDQGGAQAPAASPASVQPVAAPSAAPSTAPAAPAPPAGS